MRKNLMAMVSLAPISIEVRCFDIDALSFWLHHIAVDDIMRLVAAAHPIFPHRCIVRAQLLTVCSNQIDAP